MNIFSLFIIAAAFTISTIRIVVLWIRSGKRRKEIMEAESEDRLIFHEEIDDLDIAYEVKQSAVALLGFFVFPLALLDVCFHSYAGTLAKSVVIVSIVVVYFFTARVIDKPRRD